MRRRVSCAFLIVLAITAGACKEEGSIKVHKIAFTGVKAVDQSRLKSALATRESSMLPWGKKNYFDRSRFDATSSAFRRSTPIADIPMRASPAST